jgi:hypothetical protein
MVELNKPSARTPGIRSSYEKRAISRGSPGSGCAATLIVMTRQRIAGFCLLVIVTAASAAAQQRSNSADSIAAPATSVTNLTYPAGGVIPLRRVERRTESGGRKIIIEATEAPGVEGKWEPIEEIVTDTSQRDVFRFYLGRKRLVETTQSELETRAAGNTRHVQRTWVADLDGRLTLSSGYVEATTLVSPGIQQRTATLSLQGPEGSLREVERRESTEHQVSSAVARHDSTNSVRDLNGRWVATEARNGQARGIGSAERVEEETIQRQNLNGALVLRDSVVSRTSETNGENRVLIETYSQDAEGFVRSDSHLGLRQRVRKSTTVTADGESTVEEVEARNPVAPNDPIRVIRRTVLTTRRVAPGQWQTERQMFQRDVNGRLVLVADDTEETTEH